jgi:ferric-dicitrate binding protein FerR (iron transport regulator)
MNLEQLDELLDAYLLGDLSQEQMAQLQEVLRTDPAARSHFVRSIFVETGLHHLARSETASPSPRQQRPPEAGARRHMSPGGIARLRRLALAAAVLIAIGAIAVYHLTRQATRTFARVASGNVLVDGQPGDRLADGCTLSVTGPAPAVIHLADGSRTTLDPGTQLTLRGRVDSARQVLQLTAGGGQFQVPYGGGLFRIDTPVGSVTVLGTEFTAVLRSPRTLFLSVVTGTVRFDCEGSVFTLSSGQSRTFGQERDTSRPPPRVDAGTQVMPGYIHKVDLAAGTFVLGGANESQTTFRCLLKVEGRREATKILLDGQKSTFEAAIKTGRKASVTYVKVSETDLWVWKVEVTSAAK